MGQTKNFFKEKKPWSIVKDKILDYYLEPYTAKIIRTGNPILICDCFAGKGKFDDGENGSPLIIAEHIKSLISKNPQSVTKMRSVFIEKKYSDELEENLAKYANTKVWAGSFEDNLQKILSVDKNYNVFLYVDPYGIKSLNINHFDQIRNKQFSSLEMLLNFNSAGFLREGCRILKETREADTGEDELSDYESDDENTEESLNAVAGGEYWQVILKEFYQKKISFIEAEEQFFTEYSRKIKELFNYAINIPIKIKSTSIPKYRLIFATNHQDGLILMADNMNKKWAEIVENQSGGQQALFDFEFPDLTLQKGFNLHDDMMQSIPAYDPGILLKNLIVELIKKYGITFSVSHYKKQIQQMEINSEVIIKRIPPTTPRTGRPSTSMDIDKCKIYKAGK